ncbi:DUF202 domain-containing protein [Micromonospora sp. DR5-3]|uniref:DUF202 domain-containing protein n=1 Tax=unclassified Micromonospora TaxID=2617518 RepID=UPI0016523172|nr:MULTISPECIES: DUF202 domain-containing protein [unclassified Micromonospora]MCW3820245.1 DUF202 domain-containing protein [Micromonospora sp. DR5-3]
MTDDHGLAYERTMLAWRRFTLSLAAAGLGAAKLASAEISATVAVSTAVGVSGCAGIAIALTCLSLSRPARRRSLTVFTSTVGTAALAVVGLVAVLLRL